VLRGKRKKNTRTKLDLVATGVRKQRQGEVADIQNKDKKKTFQVRQSKKKKKPKQKKKEYKKVEGGGRNKTKRLHIKIIDEYMFLYICMSRPHLGLSKDRTTHRKQKKKPR